MHPQRAIVILSSEERISKTFNTPPSPPTLIPHKDRVFWSTVQNHAKAHLRTQTQKLYEERLTPEERVHYKTLQEYREACLNAAFRFQETKDAEVPYRDLSVFYEARVQRDDLAFQIVSEMIKYESFFDKLKISEEKY